MKQYKIVIVEDMKMIADYLELILSHNGYHISAIVASGEEAVVATQDTNPDLVLMDIKINGPIDGITAAAMIRRTSKVPIVFVTAYIEKEVMVRAMSAEPCAYVCKPFKGNELLETIRHSLCDSEWQGHSLANPAIPLTCNSGRGW